MAVKLPSAGARLRADLDAALAHAGEELGRSLEFDEAERHVITRAAAAADRAEEMTGLYRAELARRPEPRPSVLVKLAAEIRLSEKAAVDLVARVTLGLGAARSPRHVRAAQTRWQQRPMRGRA
ncbi:hypothetical protein ACGFK1_11750 [Mycobacterium sp. NPDC048908]|uniref:hypothetical protein n=1 Tax=Mycobacterium sp. NPDC048908 TaxID=3364292 RepID=UPI00371D274F